MHASDQRQVLSPRDTSRYPRKHPISASARGALSWLLAAATLFLLPTRGAAAPTCGASVTSGLAFGTYDVLSPAPLTSTARIRLSCPKGQAAQVSLGSGNSGRFAWRELSGAGGVLRYNVYMDAAMSVVWGDGTDGSRTWFAPGGNAQLILYGRIPAGQDAADGTYADTLTVTVFL